MVMKVEAFKLKTKTIASSSDDSSIHTFSFDDAKYGTFFTGSIYNADGGNYLDAWFDAPGEATPQYFVIPPNTFLNLKNIRTSFIQMSLDSSNSSATNAGPYYIQGQTKKPSNDTEASWCQSDSEIKFRVDTIPAITKVSVSGPFTINSSSTAGSNLFGLNLSIKPGHYYTCQIEYVLTTNSLGSSDFLSWQIYQTAISSYIASSPITITNTSSTGTHLNQIFNPAPGSFIFYLGNSVHNDIQGGVQISSPDFFLTLGTVPSSSGSIVFGKITVTLLDWGKLVS